ncbi:MAG: VOC family protein [Acidobacteriota bacterium]|nr:VOC family protein [Acidobacteriota bacterium]
MMESNQVQAIKAHLALNVKDVGRSIEFYRKLFGIEPSKVRIGYAKFDVSNPPLNFTLNEVPFQEQNALSHLGIQVASTEDVLRTRNAWIEQGLLTQDEMQTSCCFALQDKTWTRDPDGNEWEVFVVLQDNLPESEPCACGDKIAEMKSETAISCCSPAQDSISINRETVTSC